MTENALLPHARDYGELLLALVLEDQLWALRRVETLRLQDDVTVNVRVSTDYDLALTEGGRTYRALLENGTLPRLLLPLGFLAKKPLNDFSIIDQDGKPISFLTQEETALVSIAALESLAEEKLQRQPLSSEVSLFISELVNADESEGERLVSEIETRAQGREEWADFDTLWSNIEFRYLATNLAQSFIAIAVLPVREGWPTRHIVKYSYVTSLVWNWSTVNSGENKLVDILLVRLALRPAKAQLAIPLVSNSRSYHSDIEAPSNLELRLAQITQTRPGTDTKTLRKYVGKFTRVHLNVRAGSYGAIFDHQLHLEISPQRRGFIRDSMGATIFSTAALLVMLLFVHQGGHRSSTSAVPLITIVPGLLAAYLSRPTEHPLASRLYFGLRCVLALSALLAWFAAVVSVLNLNEGLTKVLVALLFAVSLGCSSLAILAYRAATGPAVSDKEA
jgi:hypothetical protein